MLKNIALGLCALALAACGPAALAPTVAPTATPAPETAASVFTRIFCKGSQDDCAHMQIIEQVIWDSSTTCIHVQVIGQDKDMVGVMRKTDSGWNDVAAYAYATCADAHVQFYGQ